MPSGSSTASRTYDAWSNPVAALITSPSTEYPSFE